jgi:hypothetical protein
MTPEPLLLSEPLVSARLPTQVSRISDTRSSRPRRAARPAGDPAVAGRAKRPEVPRLVAAARRPRDDVVHLGSGQQPALLADREPGELRAPRRRPARRHRRLPGERQPPVRITPPVRPGVLRAVPVAAAAYEGHQAGGRGARGGGDQMRRRGCPWGKGRRQGPCGGPCSRITLGAGGQRGWITRSGGHGTVMATLGGRLTAATAGCGRVMATTGTLSVHGGPAGSGSGTARMTRVTPSRCAVPSRRGQAR